MIAPFRGRFVPRDGLVVVVVVVVDVDVVDVGQMVQERCRLGVCRRRLHLLLPLLGATTTVQRIAQLQSRSFRVSENPVVVEV